MGDSFKPKKAQLDWDRIESINLDALIADEAKLEDQLETLYPLLVKAAVSMDDPKATPQTLIKLFRLTQLTMELKNMYLESAESQIQTLEETVKTQTTEMSRMKTRSGGSSGLPPSAELRTLREENLDLERRNELLARDLQRAEDSLEKELKFNQELNASLTEEKQRYAHLVESTRQLENDMKERETQMLAHRQRLVSKNAEEEEFRAQLKEKNNEINRCLTEIKKLSIQNADLQSEVEILTQELEATVGELERNAKEQDSTQQILISNDISIDELTEERDSLKIKVDELSHQLNERDINEGIVVGRLKEQLLSAENRLRESEANLKTAQNKNSRYMTEVTSLKEELQLSNTDAIRKELLERDDVIKNLKLKLEEAYRDFELLSLDWDRVDNLLKGKAGVDIESLKSQAITAKKLQEKVDALRDRRGADADHMTTLKIQVEEKEKELIELKERAEAYEKGVYGLKESIKEIKDLKLQRSIRDREIATLTKQINDFDAQVSDLADENEELRNRLGLGPQTSIDLSNVRSSKTVELQKARALSAALKKEVDSLEEERIKLKSLLRSEALVTGERAASIGLNAEELVAVEEYAARLRSGDRSDPTIAQGARPVVINGQLEKLVIELERLHIDGEDNRKKIEDLQLQLSNTQNKNRALEAVIREVSTTFVKTRSDGKDEPEILERSLSPSKSSDKKDLAMVEKLVAVLENKNFNDVTRDLDGNEGIEENILQANTILRNEIVALKAKLELMEKERNDEKRRGNALYEELTVLKKKSRKAKAEILNLPAELLLGSVHDYSSIVEQLVECLRELHVKDHELRECQESIEKFDHFYTVMVGKQRHLYKEYQMHKKESAEKIQESEEALRAANLSREAAEIKANDLDKVISTLKDGTHDTIKRELIESQRRVTVLKVNEMNLKRRYSSLADVEKNLRKENVKLHEDVLCLDNAARQTIGRLMRSKKEISQRLDTVFQRLKDSVPKADYNTVQSRLDLCQAKTRLFLDKERSWIEDRERNEGEARELIQLRRKVEQLESDIYEAHELNKRLGSSLKEVESAKDYNYQSKLSDALHKLARLESSQEVLHRRAELADNKWKTFEESEGQLKARLREAEQLYREASEETIKLRELNVDLRNKWEGGATRKQKEDYERKIEGLEEDNLKLREDINQYKDLAEIAGNQASELLNLHKMDQKEKQILRAAVEELQVEGDDKLLIGKLHHHILALQVSEATALRKLEVGRSKCLRLETALLNAERAIEEKENVIFELRKESRKHINALQKTVVDLRSRVYGQVTLDKHERTCDLLRSIDARRSSLEKSLAVLEEEKQELQGKLAEADFKLDSQDELVSVLKNESKASQKIVAWQSKMADAQLNNLKLTRELDLMKKRDAAAQNTIDDYLGRISAMEEDIVKIQIKSDRRELEWDKRQEDLERKLGTLEDEREVVLRSSATAEVKAIVLDRSMPLSKQLESSLRLLSEKSQLASAQEMKIAHLEAEVSTLSKKLEDAIRRTVAKDSHINELRQTVATRDLREVDIEEKIDVRTRNLYSDREAEAMHRAQEVIMSLQKQLRKKEELVDKYRDMIKSIRRETHSQTNAEKAGKEELTELINEMNDKNVANLQKPRDVKVIPMEQSTLGPIVEELEKILQAKEKEVNRLQDQIVALESRHEDYKHLAHQEIHAVRMELEDRKKTEEKLERLIEQLRGEVTQSMMDLRPVADMEAEAEAAKLLREQVVRLRRDVEKKDSRIMAMGKALAKMEDAMVKNAEETTEIQIRRAQDRTSGDDQPRIGHLESKLDRATKTVETLRRQCTEKDESYSKLRSEFGNLERQFSMQSEIHKRTHKALKESEFKLKKLNERYSTENLSKKSGGDGRSMATQTPEDMFRQKVERSASDLSREQWEVEKRLEKRIQDLRSKLTDKVKENEDMRKAEATLRDTLERTERDRARLQQKVAALSDKRRPNRSTESLRRQPHDSSSSHSESMNSLNHVESSNSLTETSETIIDPDMPASEIELHHKLRKSVVDINHLQHAIYNLESKITSLRQTTEVDQQNEINDLKNERKNLLEQIRMLEELNDHLRRCNTSQGISGVGMPGDYETGEDFDYRAEPGERSRKLVLVLESRVRDLMQRIHVLDGEKVRVESDVLAAKFEKEKAIANAERLERRAAELEKSLEELQRLDEERNEHIMSNGIPGLNVSLGQIRVATTRLLANKSHDEIVAVVDHLSKSMERLKYENDSLKKSGASNIKYMEMLKELKILRKEKVIMADLERARAAAAVQVNKVEAENQRLRRQAKKESDKAARATAYVQELELMKEGLVNEVAMLKNAEDGQGPDCGGFGGADMQNTLKKYSEEVARLKGQLAERDVMIANLRSTEGTTPQMAEEIRKLRRESDVWKARASKATRDLSGVLEPRDVVSDSEDPNGGLELDSRAADYVEGLREENQDLKAKLAQFDNGFMDEVEDLKSSYKDIVKRNLYYEEHIRNLCRMSGMSSERILNVEPSHERRAEF